MYAFWALWIFAGKNVEKIANRERWGLMLRIISARKKWFSRGLNTHAVCEAKTKYKTFVPFNFCSFPLEGYAPGKKIIWYEMANLYVPFGSTSTPNMVKQSVHVTLNIATQP